MNNSRGIILMIISMFAFALSDAFVKGSSIHLTAGQITLMLGLGGTISFSAACLWKGENPLPKSFFNPPVMLRNLGSLIGGTGIIVSITLTTISATISIQQLLPILVTMGAALFLGEQVGWRRWTAIFIGFLSVILIIRPGIDGFNPYAIWALVGVIGLSVRDLATKRIKDSVTSLQLSVFGYIVLIPVGVVMTAFQGGWVTPQPIGFAFMGGILATSMIAYITITASVRSGEISAIIPFRYTRLIFALFLGVVFFGERPDWQTLVGALGIIISGLFMMLRSKKA